VAINSTISLFKIKADLCFFPPEFNDDVIYFDAFVPDRQPEMRKMESCRLPNREAARTTREKRDSKGIKNRGIMPNQLKSKRRLFFYYFLCINKRIIKVNSCNVHTSLEVTNIQSKFLVAIADIFLLHKFHLSEKVEQFNA
jgi:hypothetical protein